MISIIGGPEGSSGGSGVTSPVAGSGIALSSATGAVTVTATGGVTTIAYGRPATGQVSTIASVATYTPTTDGEYQVCGNMLITAYTSGTISLNFSWTDEGNSARLNSIMLMQNGQGTIVNVANAAGAWGTIPQVIRAKANTAITIYTAGTFSLTYNATGIIQKVPN